MKSTVFRTIQFFGILIFVCTALFSLLVEPTFFASSGFIALLFVGFCTFALGLALSKNLNKPNSEE
jgi:hypothetical protein